MSAFKKITALLLIICAIGCAVGCAEKYDDYDSFKPAGVFIVDRIGDEKYEVDIDNADNAENMLQEFKKLDINTDSEGEMGTAYLYMRFYNEDKSEFLIFTIYENGSCCLGEEYENFYEVTNGRKAYNDLCELYTTYDSEK